MHYHVNWEIEVEAKTAIGAARQALQIQRDEDAIATVFTVTGPDGKTHKIDLIWETEKETNQHD